MKQPTHTQVAQIHELRAQAKKAGLFVVEKADRFLLYREMPPRNVLVGAPSTLAGLKRLISRASFSTAPAKH